MKINVVPIIPLIPFDFIISIVNLSKAKKV